MSPSSKIDAALLKVAAEAAVGTPSVSDWLINGINPQIRDSIIGAGVGGLIGGVSGLGEGRSFLGSALGGALIGGAGGYFRKPLWDMASPMIAGLKSQWKELGTPQKKPTEQTATTPQVEQNKPEEPDKKIV